MKKLRASVLFNFDGCSYFLIPIPRSTCILHSLDKRFKRVLRPFIKIFVLISSFVYYPTPKIKVAELPRQNNSVYIDTMNLMFFHLCIDKLILVVIGFS